MKKKDFYFGVVLILFFLPFFISDTVFEQFMVLTKTHAYIMSFIKFAVLATLGEVIGLRIRTGHYSRKGFGLLPRALVWGFLGITIKIAFEIFGTGAPDMLASMGISFPPEYATPSAILKQSIFESLSWLHLLSAFAVATTMNIFFAPFFMTIHKISDEHINETGGTLKGFFTPFRFGYHMENLNWGVMYNFVFKRTIPIFWIPAQTITFILPPQYRILFAAFLGIILGVFMAIASHKSAEKKA